MQVSSITDIGNVRKTNEDRVCTGQGEGYTYAIVADGMGGHQAGEVASAIAVDVIQNHIINRIVDKPECAMVAQILREAFVRANTMIYAYAEKNYKVMGMGTTATAAVVYEGRVITAHVGDSRAYLLSDRLRQITKDHSYVQELLARGEITPEQAKHHPKKNYITRAMGTEETVKVDIEMRDAQRGTVFLCSDGLSNLVMDDEIEEVIRGTGDLDRAMRKLVDMAKARGGNDNITVAAIKTEEGAADYE